MLSAKPSWVRSLMAKLTGAPFALTLWDGLTTRYGRGKPKFHLKILKPEVIRQMFRSPQLGFSEAYLAGDIEVEGNLNTLIKLALSNQHKFTELIRHQPMLRSLGSRLYRPTSISQQRKDISHHYDLGNDFYQLWLDQQMVYSCGYFKTPRDSIDRAQQHKIDHTLAKLRLKRGEQLLDIGSGWGALIINAAKSYGVKATGITLSKEQLKWTEKRIKQMGLGRLVKVKYLDYRELPKTWHRRFDKWVSVGMYEHVGKANWSTFMMQIMKILKPSGVGLLHTIFNQDGSSGDPFAQKYIFPGGYIPALHQLIADLQSQGFHVLDVENLERHYLLTLESWRQRFEEQVGKIRAKYGERFVRMWRIYLVAAAEGFRHGNFQVAQVLFSNGSKPDWPLQRPKI